MKRKILTAALSMVLAIVALSMVTGNVYADDPPPLDVDIAIVGDDADVEVDIYGDNPDVYINGQDIQEPTVYAYTAIIANLYDDSALWDALGNIYEGANGQQDALGGIEANLGLLSEGLGKAILALESHNSSISKLAKELEGLEIRTNTSLALLDTIDKELASDIKDLEARLLEEIPLLEESLNNYIKWVIVGVGIAFVGLLAWLAIIMVKIRK